MNPGQRWRAGALARVCALAVAGLGLTAGAEPLEQGFQDVPMAERPWVYWWWLNGNVDKRTIRNDLEAMKRVGVGGLLMFDARGYHDDKKHVPAPPSAMEFMSPEWRKLLKYGIEKAAELGLEVSVNLSSCAGALKGPWEVGDDAPKKLVWTTAATVEGPRKFSLELQKPEGKRFWDVALIAVRASPTTHSTNQWQDVVTKLGAQPTITNVADVVDLTSRVDKQGRLTLDVPKGHWTLLRFGCVTLEGHEYDVDILDPKAVEGHFDRMGRAIMEDVGSLAGKTLTHFYSVSWEGAVPTWTPSLAKEFENRRGYPLRLWLPVLAGFTLKSAEVSESFQRDYYKTLGDCFRDNFYGKMQSLCASVGLKWHSESGGARGRKQPSFAVADQLAYLGRNDMPQGEFWFTGSPIKRRQDMNRPQAMAAHIYGKRLAASEAFTHMVQHWSAYPAVLKPFADSAFCDGVNHLIWHTFSSSPRSFGQPGIEYFAGTHLNPNVTWFPQAGPFLTYLGRCQFLLRQGLPVNDVCVYTGDAPYQHWGRGTKWSTRATLELPKGFNYDLLSTEALLERLSVRDGNLVLPDGLTYRMLVVDLDDETIPPAALRKIAELRGNGAAVILGQRKPQRGPGLAATPARDESVRRGADTLWAKPGDMAEVMGSRNIAPDFEGPFEYAHRREGKTDIYFISGQGMADCTFRVCDRRPELWDPVTGTLTTAASWQTIPGERTTVTLTLPENGSVFVVFRTFDQARQSVPPTPPAELALTGSWKVKIAGKSVVFDELTAWDKNADDDIKFFSGTATYRKTFELTAEQAAQRVRLQLGAVKCLAQVRLNGKDLGIVWTAPWRVELTGALKAGKNELEIEVTNTWVNRLIGDAGLPEKKRVTKTNVALETGKRTLKSFQSFASEDPLMTSGLLGPVRLELLP
jgi:hypothetical protein